MSKTPEQLLDMLARPGVGMYREEVKWLLAMAAVAIEARKGHDFDDGRYEELCAKADAAFAEIGGCS